MNPDLAVIVIKHGHGPVSVADKNLPGWSGQRLFRAGQTGHGAVGEHIRVFQRIPQQGQKYQERCQHQNGKHQDGLLAVCL